MHQQSPGSRPVIARLDNNVSRGDVDDVIGVVRKQDLLDQALAGRPLDPLALVKEAMVVHETTPVLSVLEQFKKRPIRMAVIVDE